MNQRYSPRVRHTIISWDCSFRNCHHLVDAIAGQDYPLETVELLFVEQRSREFSNRYNITKGFPPLSAQEKREDLGALSVSIEYLEDPPERPYHLGRCVNRGLSMASGEIVSVMDGDLLLPSDFLKRLDRFHGDGGQIGNLVRRNVPGPVGAELEEWWRGEFDYRTCLDACPDKGEAIPETVSNKGPMISTRKEVWQWVKGYSEHPLWSTGLSRLGQDVTCRLENALGVASRPLPDCVAVHPYHPAGFSRQTLDSRRILSLQEDIIDHTRQNGIVNHEDRRGLVHRIYSKKRKLFRRVRDAYGESDKDGQRDTRGLMSFAGHSWMIGRAYGLWRKAIRDIIAPQWRWIVE